MNASRLKYFERRTLYQGLDHHPKLKEIYFFKKPSINFIKYEVIKNSPNADQMALTTLDETKTLRTTVMS